MRIIAGNCRGRALTPVGKGNAGAHLRPTTDRVRESLFNVLSHQIDFGDLRVLDLFAGTGALGLEALSRGAAHVTFVDDGRVAQSLIRKNIELTESNDRAHVIRRDSSRLGNNPNAPHDLIFLDPPYGKALGQRALAAVTKGGWVADDALIVWEENSPMSAPEGFDLHDTRKYGDTHISFMWRNVSG